MSLVDASNILCVTCTIKIYLIQNIDFTSTLSTFLYTLSKKNYYINFHIILWHKSVSLVFELRVYNMYNYHICICTERTNDGQGSFADFVFLFSCKSCLVEH